MANVRMTQTQLVRSLAESCEVNNKTARGMLDCLSGLAITEFTVPVHFFPNSTFSQRRPIAWRA